MAVMRYWDPVSQAYQELGTVGPTGPAGAPGAPGPAGADGASGPPGPSAVSADAGNMATISPTDFLIYVPESGGEEVIVQSGPPPEHPDLWVDLDTGVEGGVGLDQATADTLYVNVTGDTMDGSLAVTGGVTVTGDVTTANLIASGAVTATGDVVGAYGNFTYGAFMNDNIIGAVAVPNSDTDAANKQYVDSRIWRGTQAEYDAIATKDATVLYVITG